MTAEMIKNLKIRGYVTPEDLSLETDAEKLQGALDLAVREDIRKVIVENDLVIDGTVKLPAGVELKFGAGVHVTGNANPLFINAVATEPEKASWSFEDKWIYLLGEEGALLQGDLRFYHAGNLVIEDLRLEGAIRFEFCREVRMERNTIRTEQDAAVVLMRGCNNYIVQYNLFEAGKNAMVVDASLVEGAYVTGKDTDIHEMIIRSNTMNAENALFIGASEESGIFNMQYDDTKTPGNGVVIGHEGESIDKKRYFNISSADHTCGKEAKVLNNEVKHCFFGE